MPKPKPTMADARAVTLTAWRRYQHRAFKIDMQGWRYPALKLAELHGWCFIIEDRGTITEKGRKAVSDYLGIKL